MSKIYLVIGVLVLALLSGVYAYAYRAGWYAHSDKVNAEYDAKQQKIIKAAEGVEKAAEEDRENTEVETKVITRQVIKYVQDPNRTQCTFDDERVRIKQNAVNLANGIGSDAQQTVPDATTKQK